MVVERNISISGTSSQFFKKEIYITSGLYNWMRIDFYDVYIILNMMPYYLLLILFALLLNFLSQFSIDVFCLKGAHVTLKSHVTVKFRHGQVKVTPIITKTPKNSSLCRNE